MSGVRETVRDVLVAVRYRADMPVAAWGRLSRAARTAIVVAAAVTLTTAVGSVLWMVGAPPDGNELAVQRARQLHGELDDDFEVGLRNLPSWATLTLDGGTDGDLAGTVAVAGPDVCVGMAVHLDADWLLDGDEAHVTLGEVDDLDPSACRRNRPR